MIVEYAYNIAGVAGGIGLIMFALLLRELRTAPVNPLHPDFGLNHHPEKAIDSDT